MNFSKTDIFKDLEIKSDKSPRQFNKQDFKKSELYQFPEHLTPVALCPKVKEGFGASTVPVSLFSAGFPNGYGGGGCCVGALGLLKEKPPVEAGAGASSASLLPAPKTKAEGAKAAAAALSFFSSGFPKENVGAAGSLSAFMLPNVVPPCGVVVVVVDAKLGSPNPPKTEPAVVAAVVDGLVSADVVFDEVSLSLLS